MKPKRWMKAIFMSRRIAIESRDEWEEIRERGYWTWILEKGVIRDALPSLLFYLGFYFLVDQFWLQDQLAPWWFIVVLLAVSSVALGYYWANRAWRRARERFE